ncbi:MAG TPA: right-handed parallel beta-helix repeat-containing protein [Candidatus Thermoplasmatota archaeon]|nr:right-handed parallel beta-helix repeat-containing protein [Candidatus Thermoplasmatota archaeon]
MGMKLAALSLTLLLALSLPAVGLTTPQDSAPPPLEPFTFPLPEPFSDPGAPSAQAARVELPPVPHLTAGIGPLKYTPRPPIVIRGDGDLTLANGVVSGSGTVSDPYLISGWEIDGRPYTNTVNTNRLFHGLGYGITITGTTKAIKIAGNYLHNHTLGAIVVQNARDVVVENNDILLNNPNQPPNPSATRERLPVIGVGYLRVEDGAIRGNRITVTSHQIPYAAGAIVMQACRSYTRDFPVEGNQILNTGNFPGAFVGITDLSSESRHAFGKEMVYRDNKVTNRGLVSAFLGLSIVGTTDPIVASNRLVNVNPGVLSQALFLRFTAAPVVTTNVLEAGRAGGTAAWLLQSADATVLDNRFLNSTYGLIVQQSPAAILRGSTIDGNTYGFGLYGVLEKDFALDANDTTNRINGKPLVYLRESPTNRFVSNRTVDVARYDPGWFGIYRANNTTVVNLSVGGSVQGGLFVGLRSSRIVNATNPGSLRGVELALTNNTTITGFQGAYVALNGAIGNRVQNSTFTGGLYGVRLFLGAHGARIEHNRFEGLGYAIVVNGSSTTNATLNVFVGNDEAFLAEGSSAAGASLHHNNFLSRLRYHVNAHQATVKAHENYWAPGGQPTRGAPGDNVDIVTTNGGAVLTERPSPTSYATAGPQP